MKNIRLSLAKIMTYIQLISFISIPVYLLLSLIFLEFISNGIIVSVSVGVVILFVIKFIRVTPYLK